MRLLDARKLRQGETLRADLCIVGSGPAGMTLAMELAEAGLDIVLLESGNVDLPPEIQDLNRGRQVGINTWQLHEWRLRSLGGTSRHWTGFCRPLSPEDFSARDWVQGSGWPIDYDTMRPFYQRAHQTLELGEFDYDAKRMSEQLGTPLFTDDDSLIEPRFYRLSAPIRFGSRYRATLEESAALRVYLYATLVEIVLENDLNAVARLRCATLEGREFAVEAERYVLALGGLENARMLLASSAQLDSGVANSSGRVGCCFMEHPHYLRSATIVWNHKPDLDFYRPRYGQLTELEGNSHIGVLGAFGLRSEVRAREQLLNVTCALLVDDEVGDTNTRDIGAEAVGALLGNARKTVSVTRVSCRSEQVPDEASRLTLGEERDALGVPRIELDWRVTERDKRSVYRALQLIGSELGRLDLGRIWVPHVEGAISWKISPAGHHMGTTRLGADSSLSVVDADLRCHDHENLYIAGASVFATAGDANPTLTLVALSHRLADHLRDAS